MSLHSPTTLLSNIQFMRNRLRSDKELLKDIKNDFNHFSKKPRPTPIDTILEQSLRDSTPNQNISLSKENNNKIQRNKIIQLKKQHQRELMRLKQEYQTDVQKLLQSHQSQKQRISLEWKAKLDQQLNYISILEEQVSSPIQTERENVSSQQYDAVINQLLQQNSRLHNQLQQARDQCQYFRQKARQNKISEMPLRNKFEVISRKDIKNEYETADSNRSQIFASQVIVKSRFLQKENLDISNLSSQWGDYSIQNDQGCMRTIRDFPLGFNLQEASKVSASIVEDNS